MKRYFVLFLSALLIVTTLVVLSSCADKKITIVKNQETDYTVVRSYLLNSTDPVAKAASRLRSGIEAATGCPIKIDEDFLNRKNKEEELAVADKAYEILVGETTRTIRQNLPALKRDEFIIRVEGPKVLIYAGSETGYEKAVDYFLATYLGYNAETGKYSMTDLALPGKLDLRESFTYPDIVYVLNEISSFGTAGKGGNANDIMRLIVSLQGTLNRTAKDRHSWIYLKVDGQDQFWLNYIKGEGKLLDGVIEEPISKWSDFWEIFGEDVKNAGIVLWDPTVPSTANVAATICSVEGYLPVLYDETPTSLYTWLTSNGVEVKCNLYNKFTGKGTIPDTSIPSSGSAKCDAYLWALDQYMDRCNSEMIAYVLDGASCVPGNSIYDDFAASHGNGPSVAWNQIYSHDYYIYNRCFFFDLTCTDGEAPCDDPYQPIGTDVATFRKILSTISERNNGKMVKLMGFPPWYMKYTMTGNHSQLVTDVGLEWNFVDFISHYNCVKEADAAMPSWMTNASVYTQYQRADKYVNNKTGDDSITFDSKTRYFTIYMGDYDSSAWLKDKIPTFFNDPGRGEYPLMWGFNPNLSDRVPMVFDYIFENLTDNDYLVTGDSGAGYVAPSMVGDLDAWVDFCEPYMQRCDMDIVGFIINTTHELTNDVLAAYSKIAPVGSFHNDNHGAEKRLIIYNDETVFIHLMNGINPADEGAPTAMYNYMDGVTFTNFAAFRTVVHSPTEVNSCIEKFLAMANAKRDGYTYKYVDPYTLFRLALESGQGMKVYGD